MLNPLVRWEPGTLVRYHGSLTDLHGTYRAVACRCLRCCEGGLSMRFALVDVVSGEVAVSCVRARSIAPA